MGDPPSFLDVLQAFQQILLPNIEKAMGTLLKQINEQFLDGTKAYEASLRNHMELVKVAVVISVTFPSLC